MREVAKMQIAVNISDREGILNIYGYAKQPCMSASKLRGQSKKKRASDASAHFDG